MDDDECLPSNSKLATEVSSLQKQCTILSHQVNRLQFRNSLAASYTYLLSPVRTPSDLNGSNFAPSFWCTTHFNEHEMHWNEWEDRHKIRRVCATDWEKVEDDYTIDRECSRALTKKERGADEIVSKNETQHSLSRLVFDERDANIRNGYSQRALQRPHPLGSEQIYNCKRRRWRHWVFGN